MAMGDLAEDRANAAKLPEEDVIRILLEQHARIKELFNAVASAGRENKSGTFDELRAALAVHETAEEMVLRPVSRDTAGESVAEARMREEADANKVLAELERMDADSAEFDQMLQILQTAVNDHAEKEETEEFPTILTECDAAKRASMGRQIRAAESIAPTHPHPSTAGSTAAQWTVGPLASLVDRTRDAIRKASG